MNQTTEKKYCSIYKMIIMKIMFKKKNINRIVLFNSYVNKYTIYNTTYNSNWYWFFKNLIIKKENRKS